MIWRIPSKTFLVGEYAATAGGAALVLTTNPCFELRAHVPTIDNQNPTFVLKIKGHTDSFKSTAEKNIHPHSPAGKWIQQSLRQNYFRWLDPYGGVGGLGASSAQFLGVFLASLQTSNLQTTPMPLTTLLNAYHNVAWSGEGTKPSGYDVIAQSQSGCVYIHLNKNEITSFDWCFSDLDFLLVHSGHKYATHEHLKNVTLLDQDTSRLSLLAEQARIAFQTSNSSQLVESINAYQQALESLGLSAPHSKAALEKFRRHPEILAAKGCGAMGADVFLIVHAKRAAASVKNELLDQGWTILASAENLYRENSLI